MSSLILKRTLLMQVNGFHRQLDSRNDVLGCEVGSSDLEQGPDMCYSDSGSEGSGFVNGCEFLDQLNYSSLLKQHSAPWRYFFSPILVSKSLQTKGKGDPVPINPRAMKVYGVSWMKLRGQLDFDSFIREKKAPVFSYNKTNQMHQFLKFIFGVKLYMFRTVPLSIIRSFSLYTRQWYMSCRLADIRSQAVSSASRSWFQYKNLSRCTVT